MASLQELGRASESLEELGKLVTLLCEFFFGRVCESLGELGRAWVSLGELGRDWERLGELQRAQEWGSLEELGKLVTLLI